MLKMCYCGAVGRARAWHATGHGFESQRVRTFWPYHAHIWNVCSMKCVCTLIWNAAQHTHIWNAAHEGIIPLKYKFLTPRKKRTSRPKYSCCRNCKYIELVLYYLLADLNDEAKGNLFWMFKVHLRYQSAMRLLRIMKHNRSSSH